MPTVQQLRDSIKSHTIGTLNGSVLISDAKADEFLGTALLRTINGHDWQIQQTFSSTMEYPALTATGLQLPADFIREEAVYKVNQYPPALHLEPLKRIEKQQFVRQITAPDTSATFPQPAFDTPSYYFWAGALYVVPDPGTASWTIQIDYIRDFTVLVDTNPFIITYGLTVLSGALREAYLWLHEDERASVHEQNFKDLLGASIKRDTSVRVSGAAKRTR